MRTIKRPLSALLALALLAGVPGPSGVHAAARVLQSAPQSGKLTLAPSRAAALDAAPGSLGAALALPISLVLPSLPAAPAAAPQAIPAVPAPGIAEASAASDRREGLATKPEARTAARTRELGRGLSAARANGALPAFLSGLYEGRRAGSAAETLAASPRNTGPRASALWPFRAAAPAPQADVPQPAAAAKPLSPLRRAFRIGFLTTTLFGVLEAGFMLAATFLNYKFNSNYQVPGIGDGPMTWAGAAWLGSLAVIMAPIAEELIFRAGLMSYASWLLNSPARLLKRWSGSSAVGGKLQTFFAAVARRGAFWIPALLSSVIFVAGHETSDPLLFGLRMVQSVVFSWLYAKKGLMASIFAHGVNNFLAVGTMILAAALGWSDGPAQVVALLGALAVAAVFKLQDRHAGAKPASEEPYAVTPRMALLLAGILAAGVAFLSIDALWFVNNMVMFGLPAVIYAAYAAMLQRARREKELGQLPEKPLPPGALWTREGMGAAMRGFLAYIGLLGGFVAASNIPGLLAGIKLTAVSATVYPVLLAAGLGVGLAGAALAYLGVPRATKPALRLWANRIAWILLPLGVGIATWPLLAGFFLLVG